MSRVRDAIVPGADFGRERSAVLSVDVPLLVLRSALAWLAAGPAMAQPAGVEISLGNQSVHPELTNNLEIRIFSAEKSP